jgi:hypothetical protein
MTRSGFSGDAGVRDTESAVFKDSRAEEMRHRDDILR